MKQFKIVLMGSGGVGKTSITTQFTRQYFEEHYEPTIEEVHRKTYLLDGEQCVIELMDTAGIDQFAQMRDVYIREGHGFILVYSIIDKNSFEDVQIIHEQIIKGKCSDNVPIVLVGNKRDLEGTGREVDTANGEELAARWPQCIFMETSAMDKGEVEDVFAKAVRQINNFEGIRRDRISALHKEASKKKKGNTKKCSIM
ncbi:ras-related protein Rap-2b-like [Styela clava]|uniref:ras-related protein Rap-2b-like n=1 Tax=Styela clava TaxID=7725 RepID=UPI00193A48DD|nr:ras-related protein Rap-2b-like [Styela clava]